MEAAMSKLENEGKNARKLHDRGFVGEELIFDST